jgi:flagellar hook assembly protein FlgD
MGSATPVSNEDLVNPAVTQLQGNYPNPFNPETTISFSLKESQFVNIDIYNILGQRVKTLVANEMNKGTHSLIWNGTDNGGRNVASGIYFYKMQAGKYSSTKKMILMK